MANPNPFAAYMNNQPTSYQYYQQQQQYPMNNTGFPQVPQNTGFPQPPQVPQQQQPQQPYQSLSVPVPEPATQMPSHQAENNLLRLWNNPSEIPEVAAEMAKQAATKEQKDLDKAKQKFVNDLPKLPKAPKSSKVKSSWMDEEDASIPEPPKINDPKLGQRINDAFDSLLSDQGVNTELEKVEVVNNDTNKLVLDKEPKKKKKSIAEINAHLAKPINEQPVTEEKKRERKRPEKKASKYTYVDDPAPVPEPQASKEKEIVEDDADDECSELSDDEEDGSDDESPSKLTVSEATRRVTQRFMARGYLGAVSICEGMNENFSGLTDAVSRDPMMKECLDDIINDPLMDEPMQYMESFGPVGRLAFATCVIAGEVYAKNKKLKNK